MNDARGPSLESRTGLESAREAAWRAWWRTETELSAPSPRDIFNGGHSAGAEWGIAARDEALLARWDAWREQEGNGGIVSLPEAYAVGTLQERERVEALVTTLRAEIGGWRELIAMWDDAQKDEAVGKAMWAALDQIDRTKAALRALESLGAPK